MNLAELTGLAKHASPAAPQPAAWLESLKAIGGQAQQGFGKVMEGVQNRDPRSMGIAGAGAGALLGGITGGEHWLRNAILGGLLGGGAGLYGNDLYNLYDRNRPMTRGGNTPRPRGFQQYKLPEPPAPETHDFRNAGGLLGGGFGAAAGGAAARGMFGHGRGRYGALTGLLGGAMTGAFHGNNRDIQVNKSMGRGPYAHPDGMKAAGSTTLPVGTVNPTVKPLTQLLGILLGGGAGAAAGAIAGGKGRRLKGALIGGTAGAATGFVGGSAAGNVADMQRLHGQRDGLSHAQGRPLETAAKSLFSN